MQLGDAVLALAWEVRTRSTGDAVGSGAGAALPQAPAWLREPPVNNRAARGGVLVSINIRERVGVAERQAPARPSIVHRRDVPARAQSAVSAVDLRRVSGEDLPDGEGGVGQVADGEQVVLRGHGWGVTREVKRVGLVQILQRLLRALSDGGQGEPPLGHQLGSWPHG